MQYQVPVLYLLFVFVGMCVYGLDLGSLPGGVTLLGALGAAVLSGVRSSMLSRLATRWLSWFAMAGVCSAAFAHRRILEGLWDEHSLEQAIELAVLGLSAAMVSAAYRVADRRSASHGLVLVVLGCGWALLDFLPAGPLMCLAIAMSCAAFKVGLPGSCSEQQTTLPPRDWLALASMSLAVADMVQPMLDIGFAAKAEGGVALTVVVAGAVRTMPLRGAMIIGPALAALSWIGTVSCSAYALSAAHDVVVGVALGAVMRRTPGPASMQFLLMWGVGIGLGCLMGQQLGWGGWRGLLMMPLVSLAICRLPRALGR
ncbi:MAG: hypothetical protein KAI24_16425 [Planctomycetes bacterium]|nr:hypothetical protein [Planctomycetota bacterium]